MCRSLSEVHANKKSSLKSLVDCFPRIPENLNSVNPLSLMMVPPSSASQGLTHEQVMPFLKKLESGQQREGNTSLISLYTYNMYTFLISTNYILTKTKKDY